MRWSDRSGWTAMEMMVVLVVVGLLAAVGATKYTGLSGDARRLACIENQGLVDRAVRAWEHRHGELAPGAKLTFDQRGHVASSSGLGSGKGPAGDSIAKLAASPDQFVCPEQLAVLGGRAELTDTKRAGAQDYTWLVGTASDARLNGNRSGALCIHYVETGPDGTADTRHR